MDDHGTDHAPRRLCPMPEVVAKSWTAAVHRVKAADWGGSTTRVAVEDATAALATV